MNDFQGENRTETSLIGSVRNSPGISWPNQLYQTVQFNTVHAAWSSKLIRVISDQGASWAFFFSPAMLNLIGNEGFTVERRKLFSEANLSFRQECQLTRIPNILEMERFFFSVFFFFDIFHNFFCGTNLIQNLQSRARRLKDRAIGS